MHFRLATESDRGLVESLWDYCFEHREDPFFQWYFNHFYRPENVLMGFEGDDMALFIVIIFNLQSVYVDILWFFTTCKK